MSKSAKTISNLREKLQLSSGQFADKLHISRMSIWNYEIKKLTPSFRVIRKIIELAKKNNIQIDYVDFT